MTGERMREILSLLMEATEPLSAQVIMDTMKDKGQPLGINTVYSIIKQLNEFFRLFFDEDIIITIRKRGFMINKTFFEDGQIQFLLDSLYYNRDLSEEDKDSLSQLLLKLVGRTQEDRLIINDLSSVYHVSDSLMTKLTTILHAIDQEKNIAFEYVNYVIEHDRPREVASTRGYQGTRYVVSPYRILLDHNHYYLIGCFLGRKNQLSMYRIDRMRKCQSTKGAFIELREQYDMDEYINQSFNMFVNGRLIDLDIVFHEALLRDIVSRFGEDMTMTKLQDHYYRAEIKEVLDSQGLKMWLLQHGSLIRVEGPVDLKETLIEELQKSLSGYGVENL